MPTHGNCRGFEVVRIDEDHYGDVKLDGHVVVADVLESEGRPIKSPATGDEHGFRIDIPNGIEFELAEIGSATTTATGAVELDLKDSYGQFNILRH